MQDYGGDININTSPSLEAAAAKVRSRGCAALAYDTAHPTTGPLAGLQPLPAPPTYVSPYGLALRPADAGSELERRLVWALVGCAQGRAWRRAGTGGRGDAAGAKGRRWGAKPAA